MSIEVTYRPHQASDRHRVFRVFRQSIMDYVASVGLVDGRYEDDIDAAWSRQGPLMRHLEDTADEDWVAESDGDIVGWARTVDRDGHIQLTHFFVHPTAQGSGVGRGLLSRSFPVGKGRQRSILATQNPMALGLYLRFGVEYRGLSLDFEGTPTRREMRTDLVLEPTPLTERILQIDQAVLGYQRNVDLEFLTDDRTLYSVNRGDDTVGYVFGQNGPYVGPAAVLQPPDLADALFLVEQRAVENGSADFRFTLPANASSAVRWALENGYRIDPFYEVLLADTDSIALDRYLMTQPSFIW